MHNPSINHLLGGGKIRDSKSLSSSLHRQRKYRQPIKNNNNYNEANSFDRYRNKRNMIGNRLSKRKLMRSFGASYVLLVKREEGVGWTVQMDRNVVKADIDATTGFSPCRTESSTQLPSAFPTTPCIWKWFTVAFAVTLVKRITRTLKTFIFACIITDRTKLQTSSMMSKKLTEQINGFDHFLRN